MASNRIPYKGNSRENIKEGVIGGKRLPIPNSTPVDFCTIIKKCWAHKRSDRPSSVDLLKMLDEYIRNQGKFNSSCFFYRISNLIDRETCCK